MILCTDRKNSVQWLWPGFCPRSMAWYDSDVTFRKYGLKKLDMTIHRPCWILSLRRSQNKPLKIPWPCKNYRNNDKLRTQQRRASWLTCWYARKRSFADFAGSSTERVMKCRRLGFWATNGGRTCPFFVCTGNPNTPTISNNISTNIAASQFNCFRSQPPMDRQRTEVNRNWWMVPASSEDNMGSKMVSNLWRQPPKIAATQQWSRRECPEGQGKKSKRDAGHNVMQWEVEKRKQKTKNHIMIGANGSYNRSEFRPRKYWAFKKRTAGWRDWPKSWP